MKLRVVVLAAAVVFGFSHAALAGSVGGPPPSFFNVAIGSDVAGSSLDLTPTLTPNGDGTFSASGSQTVPGAYSIVFDFTLNPDPAISGSFTLMSLSSSTQTFSVAATLGVAPISTATQTHGSFGEVVATDADSPGMSIGFGSDEFYRAEIDGNLVQALGSFSFFVLSGGPGVNISQSAQSFGVPTPQGSTPVNTSIGVRFPGFMLTAGDRVEVKSFEFVVVPEASTMSFFFIVLALILCRFARDLSFSR